MNTIKENLSEALKLFETGDITASHQLVKDILIESPDETDGLYLLSKIMRCLGQFDQELSTLKQLNAYGSSNLQMRIDLAFAYGRLPTHADIAQCRDILLDVISNNPIHDISILRKAAICCSQVGPKDKAVDLYGKIVDLPECEAKDYFDLSESLAEIGNITEAADNLEKAANLDPAFEKFIVEFNAIHNSKRNSAIKKNIKKGRYPTTEFIQADLEKTISTYIAADLKDVKKFITKESKFFTMGSCFARNIALALLQNGYRANHMNIAEHINTSYANKYFVDWLTGSLPDGNVSERILELLPSGFSRDALISTVRECDVFILTLGVAPTFFDRKTGEFILPKPTTLNTLALAEKYEFRTTTVEENVKNIAYLLAYVRGLNPSAKIIVTLSPVPLMMTFEMDSAIVADCLSKSTLRIVANEIVYNSEFKDIHYWPSFEIFRWLGCHSIEPFYGADDGAAWHVSEATVNTTVNCFLKTFSVN
ncbi:MAG: GSCFA domain-containing protein [Methylobacter sp.]